MSNSGSGRGDRSKLSFFRMVPAMPPKRFGVRTELLRIGEGIRLLLTICDKDYTTSVALLFADGDEATLEIVGQRHVLVTCGWQYQLKVGDANYLVYTVYSIGEDYVILEVEEFTPKVMEVQA